MKKDGLRPVGPKAASVNNRRVFQEDWKAPKESSFVAADWKVRAPVTELRLPICWVPFRLLEIANRIADCQSAGRGTGCRVPPLRTTADYKSAMHQTQSLRYGRNNARLLMLVTEA